MKFLTPQALAAAVLGKGGSSIQEMQRSTQAVIGVTKPHELYPKSECRILTATGENELSLNMVARQLLDKLVDYRSQVEPGADGSQLRISVLVPRAVVLGLVNAGGKGIRQLCETSSAMVKIKDPVSGTGPDASQELQLRGRVQALGTALQELNREIQLVNSEPWFHAWSTKSESASLGSTKEPSAGPAAAPTHRETRQLSPERSSDGGALAVMRVLAPPVLARTLTGPLLSEIEQKTQAKVRLSNPEECFPLTDCRVLTARTDSEESLALVARWFVERLVEVAETHHSDAVMWEDKLKLSILMPKVVAPGFIGWDGKSIKQLCDASGSYVKVEKKVFAANWETGGTQKANVRGTAKGLEQVIQEVNNHVNAQRDEPWFHHWASSTEWASAAVSTSRLASLRARPASAGHNLLSVRGSLSPAAEAGMELVGRTMEHLPRYVLEEARGFALTCVVPNRLVGSVMGRTGHGVHEVQRETNTTIKLLELPGDADNHSMSIAGPLLGTSAAYMRMMKRYLDAEREVMNGK